MLSRERYDDRYGPDHYDRYSDRWAGDRYEGPPHGRGGAGYDRGYERGGYERGGPYGGGRGGGYDEYDRCGTFAAAGRPWLRW